MSLLTAYATLLFDCDGVVLNSNSVKTKAFWRVALPYGEAAAEALVAYHEENGGESRYRKFEYFIDSILGCAPDPGLLRQLLDCFSAEVRCGLMECEMAADIMALRSQTQATRWMIVSGGDQDELRWLFSRRGIADLFDGGIFGSPDTKFRILSRELASGNIVVPALFLGDSRLDYEAAVAAGVDFLFVSGWTEFSHWDAFRREKGFPVVASLASLIP